MTSTRRVLIALLALACLGAALAGCGSSPDSIQNSQAGKNSVVHDHDDATAVHVPARWASATARDLRTLIASTDTVFVGEVSAFVRQQTAAERGADASATGDLSPAERRLLEFPVSSYEVRVVLSLAGDVTDGSRVVLEQPGGLSTRADGSQVRVMLKGDEPVEVGKTYLFFAYADEDGSVTSSPFGRFPVGADGALAPVEGWETLPVARLLGSLTVEEAAGEIAAAAH